MAPIWDNLKFIKDQFADDEKMQAKIDELLTNDKIIHCAISIYPRAHAKQNILS